ncbi:MAG TPA: hypothetical protein VNC78_11230 [Actinomycetota bacterium]|nr:hypothetical protein [Actinomycetota bacterium]
MDRRVIALATVVLVALYAMILLPARAAGTVVVPADVSIEDPPGDANGINDQGVLPRQVGDHPSELYITSADILRVWFTDTPDDITAHIQTDLPPPNPNYGLTYRVMLNPTAEVPGGCLWFEATIPSVTWRAPETAVLRRHCLAAQDVSGEVAVTEMPDATGVVSITVPRSAAPEGFAAGAVLRVVGAASRFSVGTIGPDGVIGVKAPQLDNTLPGDEYTVGPSEPTSSAAPPPPTDGPEKKCTRKGKQKRCKKRGDGSEPVASPSPSASPTAAEPTAVPTPAPSAPPTMEPTAAPIPTPRP